MKSLPLKHLARVILLTATVFIASIDIHLPALPLLVDYFQTTELIIQITVMMNAISTAFLGLFYGRWGDIQGRRPTLLAAFAIFLAGNLGCILSPTVEIFIAARFIQSLGACGIGIITMTLLTDLFKGSDLAKYMSKFSALFPITWIISPIISAQLLKYFNWQAGFMALLLWASLACYLVWRLVPETIPEEERHAPYPLSTLGQKLRQMLTCGKYIFPVTAHSLPIACFGTYIINSPFIFIETYGYTPVEFSLIQVIPITATLIGTQVYSHIVLKVGIPACLKIGLSATFIFAGIALASVVGMIPQSAHSIIAAFSLFTFFMPFVVSSGAALGMQASLKNKALGVGLMAMVRNVSMFIVAWLTGLAFDGTITPVFIALSLTCCVMISAMILTLRGGPSLSPQAD